MALRFMVQIDPAAMERIAKQSLLAEDHSVACAARKAVRNANYFIPPDEWREMIGLAKTPMTIRQLLSLSRQSKWDHLGVILELMSLGKDQDFANDELHRWLARFNKSFAHPSQQQGSWVRENLRRCPQDTDGLRRLAFFLDGIVVS